MLLHLFTSGADPEVFAFTADPTGTNLPTELKPWQKSGSALNVRSGEAIGPAGSSAAIIDGVRTDGYYLARGGVKITRAIMPQ
jgi:hypothetical protein